MTATLNTQHLGNAPQRPGECESRDIHGMFMWALGGLIFIINAFVTAYLVDDGGFVSSVSALLAAIILLIPMIRTIIGDVRSGTMRMHELVVIAVIASSVQGDFRTSSVIAFFLLLSMIIETRTASGARASLEALARLSPGQAHRLEADGSETDVAGPMLEPEDRIRVRPGESVLADGRVVNGRSSVNEANITGESLPVDKAEGDTVFAGTSNLTGVLEVIVLKAGEDTTIGKVRELILKAEASRLPFVRMIDTYVRYYTPLVIIVAATVLFFTRGEPDALNRVIAVLVATCPIALILATPTAVVASLSASARLGILIKDVNDLEAMARTDAFVFDKTGTLTTGTLEVSRLSPAPGFDSSDLLRSAAAAEASSNHPVAKAILALARKVNVPVDSAEELHEEFGRGVRARVNGHEIIVGNLPWMVENGASAEKFEGIDNADVVGMSQLFVLSNGVAQGWIGVSDTARPDAVDCLSELAAAGVRFVAMVSGDRQQVVDNVAAGLTLQSAKGQCTPVDKVDFVEDVKKQGFRVAFVGDGVNDGPALASSHIGIAMGAAGSDVALESATVALMNNELNRLPFMLRLARKMRFTILQNFCLGGVLICGGVTFGAMGLLAPVPAAALQVVGALCVAMNSARLIRQGEELEGKADG